MPGTGPRVSILMGLYDGAAHLREQLDSLAAQTHADWHLIASDDRPGDGTGAVLAAFAEGAGAGRVEVREGPGRGAAANYLSLIRALPEGPGWLAFADQDDRWLPERLARGIAALSGIAGPALHCSRTWILDPAGGRRLSPPRPRPPGFRNALVQNIAAGNTILLNPEGAALVRAAAKELPGFVVHDWWIYQILTGAGGRVLHDDRPALLYRQHCGNQIGANDGWHARWRRLGQVADGTFRGWNAVNLAALEASAHRLTPEARGALTAFRALHEGRGALRRLRILARAGFYRQSAGAQAALWLAAALGKV